jgi:hypothetical protein
MSGNDIQGGSKMVSLIFKMDAWRPENRSNCENEKSNGNFQDGHLAAIFDEMTKHDKFVIFYELLTSVTLKS